jgi:U3 small nucleolar RNA-associated protein 12
LFSGSKDTTIIGYDLISSSSLFKLTSHKDAITSLQCYNFGYFSDDPELAKYQNLKVLVSASKDSLIKIWNVAGQYSIDASLGFTGGVSALAIAGHYLLASSDYGQVKVYELKVSKKENTFGFIQERGEFKKTSKERTICIQYYKPKKIIAILSNDGTLEIWHKNSQLEIAKRIIKSYKRKLEKNKKKVTKEELREYKTNVKTQVLNGEFDTKYLFTLVIIQALGNKARSFYLWKKAGLPEAESLRALIGYSTNLLELWSIKEEKQELESTKKTAIEKIQDVGWWGHRTPIRTCIVSPNDKLLVTASNEATKVWNVASLKCTKSIPLENITCGTFIPGEKFVVLGSKEGYIYVLDLSALEVAQKIEVVY